MPTRDQKLVSCGLWRVTVEGGGARRNKILGRLEGLTLRGGTVVNVEKKGLNWILFRWNPPRKYDSVWIAVEAHIKAGTEFRIEPGVEVSLQPVAASAAIKPVVDIGPQPVAAATAKEPVVEVAPQPGAATAAIEPVVEVAPRPVAAASAGQVAAPAAQVAGSAATACPQRLLGGFLALKFQSLEGKATEGQGTRPSTAGLSIFEDKFLGQGTFGVVYAAEYNGENAVAKVFSKIRGYLQIRG